jgi:putative oxidoreductase
MKTTAKVARILLGLTFLLFGLNGLFQFVKLPPPSGVALQFMSALVISHESVVIMGLQVLGGALLLLNRFVPLVLFVLAPIVLNILFFSRFHGPRWNRASVIRSRALGAGCAWLSRYVPGAVTRQT